MLATAGSNGVKLNVISSAVATNEARKDAMARRVIRALEGDAKDRVVAVLGLTFKANTDDVRETPALALIEGLKQAGASVRVFDPKSMVHARQLVTDVEFCGSARDACSGADCVVIATEWQEFRALDVRTLAQVMRGRTIVDLRNLLDHEAFVSKGFVVHSIGRPVRLPARMAVAQRRRARGSDEFAIRKRERVDVAHGVAL
jgi:UDPglucose 6-dehydrogenase